MTGPSGPGVATGADVPTLARGRLVSGGRPERSWGGRVDSGDTKGVAPSPWATVDRPVAARVPGGGAGGLAAVVVCPEGWGRAVGSVLGSGDGSRPVGWPGPRWTFSVGGTISTPWVTTGLTGACSAATPGSAGGLLGLGMGWVCMDWGIPVLFVTFVTAGVSQVLWDCEEVGGLEVTAGEATGLEEGPAGKPRLGKACRGVVLTGKEPGPGTVTALVMSGKRGAGGDWEETVMLGLPAKVMVTLVVSMAPNTMPGVDICRKWGRDEDLGACGVLGRLAVTPLLARAAVAWAGRLDAVTPRGSWVGAGGSGGPSVAARDGFRAVVGRAAGVNAGLCWGAPGVSCGNCSSWSLGVGSS